MPEVPPLSPIADAPLSVVLLARDDGPRLDAVVSAWNLRLNGLKRDFEILLIDDGSGDGSADIGKGLAERMPRLRFLRHEQPRGEGVALRTAVAEARHPLLLYSICDPRYRPDDVHKLLAEIDRVHMVTGYRAAWPVPGFWKRLGSAWRLFSSLVFSHKPTPLPGWLGWRRHLGRLLVRIFFGVRHQDVACPYRLLRREILARMPIQSRSSFVHVELLAKANFLGRYASEEVPLGDLRNPTPPVDRPGNGVGRIWSDALHLFNHPDFGPVDADSSKPLQSKVGP
jgi:glycosyltransferase involved in cell wall biosynthesis